jgi:hypothetical protein
MEEPKKKRFRIVKLEERVVPSHLSHVAEVVVGPPAVEHAPQHAHKVGFAVFAATGPWCPKSSI